VEECTIILKCILKIRSEGMNLVQLADDGGRATVGFCKHGNELSGW
jgi:hypothetical protein